ADALPILTVRSLPAPVTVLLKVRATLPVEVKVVAPVPSVTAPLYVCTLTVVTDATALPKAVVPVTLLANRLLTLTLPPNVVVPSEVTVRSLPVPVTVPPKVRAALAVEARAGAPQPSVTGPC